MKHSSRTVLGFCVLCFLTSVKSEDGKSDLLVNRRRMHNVVKSMLGFSDSPNMPHPQHSATAAPKYMLDLYERFRQGPISTGKTEGNTVRSIEAKIDVVNDVPMFVFNLTSVTSTEQLISAEIHLYKRKRQKFNKKSALEILLHEVAPHETKDSGNIVVNPESYGWQWFDVTGVVLSCLSDSYSLGLNFKVVKPHGNSMLQLKRFVKRHSVPYLIIYSNDSKNIDLEDFNSLSEQSNIRGNEVDVVLSDITKRNKRSLSDNSADLPVYNSRARSLSLLTNEIPEDPEDYNRPYPIDIKTLQTHPGMLQTRKESRHKLKDQQLIPYPGEYQDKKSKRNRNKKRKNKKSKRRKNHIQLPKEWKDLQQMAEEEKSDKACSKKNLIVDFNDIGWGEWIISPKSFKAHYCSGVCTFPLTKKMRPSNHATIQSLVNAVGLDPDVPAPCCVPDKLSSITLLYFDENWNVVLKNYPNMTVQKCACR